MWGATWAHVRFHCAGRRRVANWGWPSSAPVWRRSGSRRISHRCDTEAAWWTALCIIAHRHYHVLFNHYLEQRINQKATVINQYESGKAIPRPQLISQMERALGVKLPRPGKKKKAKKQNKK